MKPNVKMRFLVPALALFIAGMSTLAAVAYLNTKDALKKAGTDQMVFVADLAQRNTDLWIEEIKMALRSWSEQQVFTFSMRESFIGYAARKAANVDLGKFKGEYGYYEHIALSDRKGQVVAASSREIVSKLDVWDRDYFRKALKGEIFVSSIIRSKSSGDPVFVISVPVKEGKEIVGVLFGVIEVAVFSRKVLHPIKVGATGYAFMVGKDGSVFTQPEAAGLQKPDTGDFSREIMGRESGTILYSKGGSERVIAYRKSLKTGWIVGVDTDTDELFAPVGRIGRVNLVLALVIVTLTGVVLFWIARIGIIGDINDLIRSREAAESATRAKDDFLAAMSHEIRTPMNAIIGMTDLILETNLRPQQREYLEVTRKSADHLLGLISSILDLSKIEAKKLDLEVLPFDLKNILRDTIAILAYQGERKGLKLSYRIEDVPTALRGDPHRLRQIIVNLVGNSIKFTEKGTVSLSVERAGVGSHHHEHEHPPRDARVVLVFSVEDTGIGIPKDKLGTIFESFTQLDSSYRRKYGGTGLGLSISKRLVELMGGEIGCESEEGKGTTFHFTIPFERAAPEDMDKLRGIPEFSPREREAGEQKRPLHILMAEDFEVNQQLVVSMLEKYEHAVHVVNNGQEALEALEADTYDLVLMDVQMPVMDGMEATRRIRDLDSPEKARIPVIALSAHAVKGDREKFLRAGMDEYITKPIEAKRLLDVIEKVLGETGIEPGPASEGSKGGVAVIDLDYALRLMGGDENILLAGCRTIVDKVPQKLQELRKAVSDGDVSSVERVAHAIKSAAKSVGARQAAESAYQMELAGKDRKPGDAECLMPIVERDFRSVLEELDRVSRRWPASQG